MSQPGWTDKRPMSPHLTVWRWHVTMAGSIFHRASGMANAAGLVLLVAWLAATAAGPEAYDAFSAAAGSPAGLLVLAGFTLSLVYHLLNGIRHLFWDAGKGLEPGVARMTGWLTLALTVVVSAAIWGLGGGLPF